jgi:hypothetical protein
MLAGDSPPGSCTAATSRIFLTAIATLVGLRATSDADEVEPLVLEDDSAVPSLVLMPDVGLPLPS